MPEIPDLEGYRSYFNQRLLDRRVEEVEVFIPYVLRSIATDFNSELIGATFHDLQRVGKYLLFHLSGQRCLVVNAMLTGRFQYCEPKERKRARTVFQLSLDNGMQLRYADLRLMGKIYLVGEDELSLKIPRLGELGPDPLSPELSEEDFLDRLKAYRGQIKGVLTKEQLVAGIGNAYSDEVLFAAGIHPFRKASDLSEDDRKRLYLAVRSVFEWSIPIVRERMENEGLPTAHYRDHLKVHRRGGQPCPNCGATISDIGANERITSFCRHCQT